MLNEFQKIHNYPMGDGVLNQLDSLEGLLRDTALNRGPGGSIILLQKALNETINANLTTDGGMGPNSRKAVMDLLSKNPPKGHEDERDYWMDSLLKNFKKSNT